MHAYADLVLRKAAMLILLLSCPLAAMPRPCLVDVSHLDVSYTPPPHVQVLAAAGPLGRRFGSVPLALTERIVPSIVQIRTGGAKYHITLLPCLSLRTRIVNCNRDVQDGKSPE